MASSGAAPVAERSVPAPAAPAAAVSIAAAVTDGASHPPERPLRTTGHGQSPGPEGSPLRGVTVAVVDPAETIRMAITDHMKGQRVDVVAFDGVASLVRAIARHGPTVVVVGPSESPQLLVGQLEPLLGSRSDLGAVMVVHSPSPEVVRSAFRAGVDDVVPASAADAELLGAIGRAASRVRSQPPATGISSPTPASHRRIVTVFSTKGGTGKSVVAVNLAVTLARQTAQPTVLVDANLQFGDAAIMLQLPPAHTITDVVLAGDRLDGELLDTLLLHHDPSGLAVLAAPPNPESADQIGRSDLTDVLTLLHERCAYVVIDTSPRIDESTLAALEAADDILLVTNLDVMSLKNARLALQTLDALGISQAKVKLVLNRANTQGGLTRADAERAVRMKVNAAVPSDPLVADSVNRGVPMVLSAPTSKFALAVDDLARALRARSSARPA